MPYVPPRVIGPTSYFEGEDIITLWRPRAWDGTLIIDSLVTDWSLYVYEVKAPTTPFTAVYSITAQSPSSTMFSSAQTPAGGDGAWDEDPEGYTFRHALTKADLTAASAVLDGGKHYRLEYVLNTPTYAQITGTHLVDIETLIHQ